ncbi:MAG TPA: MFS transporter [Nocardioidaceae bacterium]|nr:MFS transporter [Nocardioidaceae bacterium]
MSQPAPVRLLTPAFVALTLSDLAYFTAVGVLLATTPLFVTGPLGGAELGVGLAMGSFSVTTLLLRPWAGRWVDRHGRRLLLVGGAAAFAVVTVGHLVVDSLPALVALRLLLGAAEAMYFVAGFAALADLAPPQRAGEALSLNSLALYVGIAVGPLLGQALLRWRGFDAAWIGAVALAVLATALATRVPETRGPVDGDAPTPLLHRAAVVPGVALFCGVAATSGFLAFAVLHAQAVGIERWSGVLLVFGGTVVVCRVALARLPDRAGPARLAAAALAVCAMGLMVVGAFETPVGLVVGTVVLALGVAFVTPAVFATVFNTVPAAERGSAAATTSVFIDLGLSGGPILLGVMAATTSLPTSFLLAAVLPAAGSLLLVGKAGRRAQVGRPSDLRPG